MGYCCIAHFRFGILKSLCYTGSRLLVVLSCCMFADLLLPMFDDDYYPDVLVAEVQQYIVQFAKKVAKLKDGSADIYRLANEAVLAINEMKPQFEDLDSSLDDTAADYIAEAMMMVVQEHGHFDVEMEELIANREW
jgi:hypothetical protein